MPKKEKNETRRRKEKTRKENDVIGNPKANKKVHQKRSKSIGTYDRIKNASLCNYTCDCAVIPVPETSSSGSGKWSDVAIHGGRGEV